ncbi:MAG: GNAT family N-acetyltransferase [Acidimicrobiia bacterium]|nr:GNAT family N-acetyltransferase [Acidimicrobiia bacterium]
MPFLTRPATEADRAAIRDLTRHTFSWGDYVMRNWDEWMADPAGTMLVAVDTEDIAIGLTRISMLSSTEAWVQATRVHQEHRRQGMAHQLVDEAIEWARDRGATVARLVIEGWNSASIGHVERLGFRKVSDWMMAERGVGDSSPVPEGNGGQRVRGAERLRPAPGAEADPAFMSWQRSPLARAARGLFPPRGWRWRALEVDDLRESARASEFLTGRPGWAIGGVSNDTFEVRWVETSPDDAYDLARSLVDAASDHPVERLEAKLVDVDWLTQAFRRVGCKLSGLHVFERAINRPVE